MTAESNENEPKICKSRPTILQNINNHNNHNGYVDGDNVYS